MTKEKMIEETKTNGKEEQKTEDMIGYFSGRGHPHPIYETVNDLRKLMLSLGFDEIQTSYFLPINDIKQLTGNLYPAFMDSIYQLSWTRLEPIPPSKDVEIRLAEMFPDLDQAELWNILDTIDEDTSGENLLREISEELELSISDSIRIINAIPDMRSGVPHMEDLTLRSFMPTSWISTLEATYDSEAFPIRLFTLATSFRREPSIDSRHIRTYNLLSVAVLDDEMDIEKGKKILKKVLDLLEIEGTEMVEKSYPFPYFEEGTELEIFGGDLELGTCGMVSKEVLEARGINAPVFIADIGVERLLMFKHGYPDIRELFFPQFFAAWNLSDEEISSSLKYNRKPQTEFGKEIASAVQKCYKEAESSKEKVSRMVAWKGQLVVSDYGSFLVSDERARELGIKGATAEVILKEARPGMGLAGPAAFNEIWINDGNIIGATPGMASKMEDDGATKTNKTYIKAFSRFVGWKIEKALERGHTGKMFDKIRDLEGINLKLSSKALHYILSHNRKIDIQGPVYLKFLFKVKKNGNKDGSE
jgi:O-phosphoseryl-tRNA synthetase